MATYAPSIYEYASQQEWEQAVKEWAASRAEKAARYIIGGPEAIKVSTL